MRAAGQQGGRNRGRHRSAGRRSGVARRGSRVRHGQGPRRRVGDRVHRPRHRRAERGARRLASLRGRGRLSQPERTALGVAADRPALAGVDHLAAERRRPARVPRPDPGRRSTGARRDRRARCRGSGRRARSRPNASARRFPRSRAWRRARRRAARSRTAVRGRDRPQETRRRRSRLAP